MGVFGSAFLTQSSPILEISSSTIATAAVEFLSISNTNSSNGEYVVFFTKDDPADPGTNKNVVIHRGTVSPMSTVVLTKDDFPVGDSISHLVGNSATTDTLYITSAGDTSLYVVYKRTDVGAPEAVLDQAAIEALIETGITSHTDNPHGVDRDDVGLGVTANVEFETITSNGGEVFLKDSTGYKSRFRTSGETYASDLTHELPSVSGILATTNKLLESQTAAYYSNSTSGFYLTLSSASISESSSLSTASYSAFKVAPYNGQIKRIIGFNQSTSSRMSTFEMYIDGDDSDLVNDQVGSDVVTASYTQKFEVNPTDWTFSKGEAIAIRRTDTVGTSGANVTVVFEYDTTT